MSSTTIIADNEENARDLRAAGYDAETQTDVSLREVKRELAAHQNIWWNTRRPVNWDAVEDLEKRRDALEGRRPLPQGFLRLER